MKIWGIFLIKILYWFYETIKIRVCSEYIIRKDLEH